MKWFDSFWIGSYDDYKEIKDVYDKGARLASPLYFSHQIEDDGKTYYCFRPTNRKVGGCLYITEEYITNVFDMLGATVDFSIKPDYIIKSDNVITFAPDGITINHDKKIKYKYEGGTTYRLQKTQYKGTSPYGLLALMVDQFWDNMIHNGLLAAGYVKN